MTHNAYTLTRDGLGLPSGTVFRLVLDCSPEGQSLYKAREYWLYVDNRFIQSYPEMFKPVIERWKPQKGDTLYSVTMSGVVEERSTDRHDAYNKWLIDAGNCFQHCNQAQEAAKRMKAAAMSVHADIAEGRI